MRGHCMKRIPNGQNGRLATPGDFIAHSKIGEHPSHHMTEPAITVDRLPFTAYRLEEDGHLLPPTLFIGLCQWFEAEKFRPYEPELFLQALMQPTVKEVRRLAKRNQARWRLDWPKVRAKVLACGLCYAARADKDAADRWGAGAEEIASLLQPLNLPKPFLFAAAQEYISLRDAPRIAFLGAAAAPDDQVGKRINSIHRRTGGSWQLVQWQGRHTSARVHNWAVKQIIPVHYVGSDGSRLNDEAIAALASSCSNVIVFERKGGKQMDRTLRALRAHRRATVELELYDAQTPALAT